jgi:hypothetical protein
VGLLHVVLDAYVRAQRIGEALVSPADIELDTYGRVQPDEFVQGLVEGLPPRDWNVGAPLLLVVEGLGEGITWRPAGAGQPLTIALAPLFARIHGEIL